MKPIIGQKKSANNLRTNLANGTYIDITDEEEETTKPAKTESKKSTQKSDDDWD